LLNKFAHKVFAKLPHGIPTPLFDARKGEDEEKKECYWQWENFIRQTIGACRVGEFGEVQLIKQLAASIAFTESP